MARLGWKECEVRVQDYENETITSIQQNNHITKSVTDIINQFRLLEEKYKKRLQNTFRFNVFYETKTKDNRCKYKF